jgi:hypothetical protein
VVLNKQQSLSQMRSFAAWLPTHAHLVRSISAEVQLQRIDVVSWDFSNPQSVALGQQLHEALSAAAAATAQFARTPPPPAAAAATEAAPAACESAAAAALVAPQQQQQQQQQQRWRLARFSCDLPGAAGMLAALPAHSLTCLELGLTQSSTANLNDLPAALARLSNLQQLKLVSMTQDYEPRTLPDRLICLAQLSQLTRLELGGRIADAFVKQLLRQPLQQLQQLRIYRGAHSPVIQLNLAHLTQLTKIAGGSDEHPFVPAKGTVLPAQLKHLQLTVGYSGGALASVLPLQQLQQLDLMVEFPQQEPLLELTQLPALQQLTLRYRVMSLAAQAAAAWVHLPKLRDLRLEPDASRSRPLDADEMQTVVQGVATCYGLTKLVLSCETAEENLYYNSCRANSSDEDGYSADELHPEDWDGDEQYVYQAVAVCESLAGLPELQDLSILCGEGALESDDVIALTALTGLTRLHMQGARLGYNQLACTFIGSLTELRDLTFDRCRVDFADAEFLAGVGMLEQLTQLTLCAEYHAFYLRTEGLMQLTGLCNLQELQVQQGHSGSDITEEVLEEFWAAVSRA